MKFNQFIFLSFINKILMPKCLQQVRTCMQRRSVDQSSIAFNIILLGVCVSFSRLLRVLCVSMHVCMCVYVWFLCMLNARGCTE